MPMFNPMQQQKQKPQENQYLQGNPATNPTANTGWMEPGVQGSATGSPGGSGFNPSTPSQQNSGTMLGNITSAPQMNREQYRDAWMSSGVKNMDQMRDWVARNGGQVLSDNGTFRTPQGETYDGLINARTGNGTPGWTPVGGGGLMGAMNQGNNSMLGAGNNQMQPQSGGGMFSSQMLQQLMSSLFGGSDMRQPMNYFQDRGANANRSPMDISSLLGNNNTGFGGGKNRTVDY